LWVVSDRNRAVSSVFGVMMSGRLASGALVKKNLFVKVLGRPRPVGHRAARRDAPI